VDRIANGKKAHKRHFTLLIILVFFFPKATIKEAQILFNLDNPNIISPLGLWYDFAQPAVYLVLPFYHNGNIKEYLERNPSCNKVRLVSLVSFVDR
jgi:serine/threonine protein kinase